MVLKHVNTYILSFCALKYLVSSMTFFLKSLPWITTKPSELKKKISKKPSVKKSIDASSSSDVVEVV